MKNIHFGYQFRAVGQGLFASGRLHEIEQQQRFNWVFDCGTNSKRAYVDREIAQYKSQLYGDPIDLFCLSHFDADHINGARALLSQQSVKVLVMPYFPLVERIQIAIMTPGLSDEHLQFLIDPAGFMFEAARDNLGEIVMISGGGEQPEEGDGSVPIDPSNNSNKRWILNFPNKKHSEQPADEDIHGLSDDSSWGAVRVFRDKQPFTVGGAWEFLFYNENIPSAKAAELRLAVADIVKKHRRKDGSFDGISLLRELKPLYVSKFGSTGLAKNRISLVTYSGPIESAHIRLSDLHGSVLPVGVEATSWCDCCRWCYHARNRSKVSIGYFGDFPLTKPERIHDVRRHFGQHRWDRLQVIQVPHHGSSHSWYDGASAEFQHKASVVSSARHSENHPSQSVLDDLATHGVVLVNEMQSAQFCGYIELEMIEKDDGASMANHLDNIVL